MRKRRASADYHALAAERGFEWIAESLPANVDTKTPWRCSEGHEWEAVYNSIRRGRGCPHCAGKVPKKETDYHALVAERGFEWIAGSLPPNTGTKTPWRCSEGHEWQTRYNNIRQGNGCPHCAGKVPKKETDYHALAAERGFEWIAESLPLNVLTRTFWRCSEGHEWQAYYDSIQRGSGCPHCAGNTPRIPADYHALVAERGFEWIAGSLPPNTKTKTLWRCSKGHEWRATYSDIRHGHGCPHCQDLVNGARVSKPQRALAAQLGGILNHPCGRRRIDVALPDDLIAVEYDCTYWHQGETGQEAAERDRELWAAGWKVLHLRADGINLPAPALLAEALGILKNTPAQALTLLCDPSSQSYEAVK